MFDMKNLSKLKMLDDNSPKAMKAFWDFNNATFEDGAISSAERTGVYKTDPGAYLAGLSALGASDPSSVLFVAGSPHDVPGASAVGMPVYWSNRFNDLLPGNSQPPLMNEKNLLALPVLLAAGPIAKE